SAAVGVVGEAIDDSAERAVGEKPDCEALSSITARRHLSLQLSQESLVGFKGEGWGSGIGQILGQRGGVHQLDSGAVAGFDGADQSNVRLSQGLYRRLAH